MRLRSRCGGWPSPRTNPTAAPACLPSYITRFFTCRVYFGNLNVDIQEGELSDALSKFGRPEIWLARNPPGNTHALMPPPRLSPAVRAVGAPTPMMPAPTPATPAQPLLGAVAPCCCWQP